MFQFAFVAALFQFRARGPPLLPLLQLPNRRATAQADAGFIPCYIYFLRSSQNYEGLYFSGGIASHPRTPYAATPTGGNRRMAAPKGQPASEAA